LPAAGLRERASVRERERERERARQFVLRRVGGFHNVTSERATCVFLAGIY
jgi:hypothetical protein